MANSTNYILIVVTLFQTFLITALVYQNFQISRDGISKDSNEENTEDGIKFKKFKNKIQEIIQPSLRMNKKSTMQQFKEGAIVRGSTEYPKIYKDPTKLFYNRVPKCGSRTIIDLIYSARWRNKFDFENHKEYVPFYHDDEYNKKTVQLFQSKKKLFLYEGHYHFMDFTKFVSIIPF